MRYYSYVEQGDDDKSYVSVLMSEDAIVRDYFEYWSEQMRRVGKTDLISRERCIEDFCVVHWAAQL